ncbi:MAG: sn-glycerol-3-phosphate ABC transporter ATP-binding protein UgpC [Lentisphaeria bacterium]|nr:sn-glycerol-3-phosphate ABC transporter ATP-binding protein UgpC [Candidatus Neomarinimicrobiota bacterium]MCF7841866.1 sn-glycerol-3-phosphate ABC transporter ATP-binding protein UgpC [Lentisphaeria bacterium]
MANVILKDIEMKFGETHVLHKMSFEIKDGEFVVLVGPSGCGKSTTLRIIAGLEEPTSGDVYIGEKRINNVAPKDRDIAMVFQNYALYPHMDVFENMAFGLKLRKFPQEEIQSRVAEAAEILGISQLLKRRPKELSGGQRQRVAVGRAIVRKPAVFLFDEPLSNLDAKLRVQMRTEIKKLHATLGTTMIYVTHDQTEAMTMGDRIVVLKDGYLMQEDKPLEIYNNPSSQFVAGFIGSPPMNFFTTKAQVNGGVALDEGNFTLNAPPELKVKDGQTIIAGIRPEHLNLDDNGPVKATVEVAELMGSESYLHATTGKHPFVARVASTHAFKTGDSVKLSMDRNHLRFFDGDTGERI